MNLIADPCAVHPRGAVGIETLRMCWNRNLNVQNLRRLLSAVLAVAFCHGFLCVPTRLPPSRLSPFLSKHSGVSTITIRINPTVISHASTSMLASNKNVEVGIQTAQLLMDPRRRGQLKKQMKERYPLIPDAFVASCIDVAADAFTRVAPDKLQTTLRPGGMARMRPELEGAIVDLTLARSDVRRVSLLDEKDKRNIVRFVVGASLDYLLKDAQEVLAAPEVRLEALEEQIREVKRAMGSARLFWYRVRHHPLEICVAVAASSAGMLVYQKRSLPMVSAGISVLRSAMAQIAQLFTRIVSFSKEAVSALFT